MTKFLDQRRAKINFETPHASAKIVFQRQLHMKGMFISKTYTEKYAEHGGVLSNYKIWHFELDDTRFHEFP